MLRYLLGLLIFSNFVLSWSATPERDAINVIIQNQKIILDKLEQNKTIGKNETSKNMDDVKNDTMSFYIKKINDLHGESADSNFIMKYYWCKSYMSEIFTHRSLITDTINIHFFANLLRSDKFCGDAYRTLMSYTSYEALESNSDYIKKNLEKSALKERDKLIFLCFLIPNEIEKKVIAASPQLQLYEKASADEKMLDSLIFLFKKDTTYLKGGYEHNLLMTGKKRAVKVVLEELCARDYNLNISKIHITKNVIIPCTTSAKARILSVLRRYYPQEPLFDKDLPPSFDGVNNEENSQKNKEYWSKFRMWVLKNYDIKLQDSIPCSHFFSGCGPQFSHWRPTPAELERMFPRKKPQIAPKQKGPPIPSKEIDDAR